MEWSGGGGTARPHLARGIAYERGRAVPEPERNGTHRSAEQKKNMVFTLSWTVRAKRVPLRATTVLSLACRGDRRCRRPDRAFGRREERRDVLRPAPRASYINFF